jgi:hypothetical protein
MFLNTFTKLIVPDMGCGYVDRVGTQAKRHLFRLAAFARALATSDEEDFLHNVQTTK